jgi:sRNA-binding protein
MALSPQLLALHYGLRLDASEAFIQGYVDGMRLDQRGQGVACGKGWIPRSKKCSSDKAKQTSKEAKAKTVEKSRERAKLKGEVKAAKGQKPRVKPTGETAKPETQKRTTQNPTPMEFRRKLAGTTGEPTKETIQEYQRIRGEYESLLDEISKVRNAKGLDGEANKLVDQANRALANEIDKLRKSNGNLPDDAINDLYGDPQPLARRVKRKTGKKR